jgi:hypothetical protein
VKTVNKVTGYLARQAFKLLVRASQSHYVIARWDDEASVWYVYESSVPGLSLEAENRDLLVDKVEAAIPELLELNKHDHQDGSGSIPLQISFNECLQGAH